MRVPTTPCSVVPAPAESYIVWVVLSLMRQLGPAWWLSIVLLSALAVVAGIEARPLICRCEQPRALPMLNPNGHYRGEGKDVEIVGGLLELDCLASGAVPDSSGKWFVRVVLLLAAVVRAW